MCLTINTYHHYDEETGGMKPLTADRPIAVFKILQRDYSPLDLGYTYHTPFRYFPVDFHGNICEMESSMNIRCHFENYTVEEGIHACLTYGEAKEFISSRCGPRCCIVLAVIPENTPFYVGEDGDIVSEKMNIYRIFQFEDPGMEVEIYGKKVQIFVDWWRRQNLSEELQKELAGLGRRI